MIACAAAPIATVSSGLTSSATGTLESEPIIARTAGIRVTNITTHTLGVVLWDDAKAEEYAFPMIRKMTPVPVQMKNSFGTAKANMKNAVVRVVEGESTVPGECTPLGICDIELPPFLPKGSPVELTYTYNENQVLEVVVEAYGRQSKVSIARNTGLSEAELETATADLLQIKVV